LEVFYLGYIGLFAASFLAATIVPFSSEVVLVGLYLEGFDPFFLVLVASLGNWLGGMTSYLLGLLGKEDWLVKFFGVKKEKVLGFSGSVKKYGYYSALLCWLPVVGDVIAVALGFFRVKVVPVAVFMLIGKMLRYIVLVMLLD